MALWHRETWAEAVWSSDLKPLERLVALAYADHAREADTAWLTYARLMERTGLSRDAVARALRGVVAAGWLVVVTPARQHRAAVYRLTLPVQQSASRTAEPVDNSPSSTGDGPLSSTPDVPLDSQQSASRHQQSVSRHPAVRETDSTSLPTSLPTPPPAPAPDVTATAIAEGGAGDDASTRALIASHGLTAAEAREVIARAKADPTTTTSWAGRLRQPAYVDALRQSVTEDRKARTREAVAELRLGPECEHGDPGGAAQHPDTGEPLCPICRRDAARRKDLVTTP